MSRAAGRRLNEGTHSLPYSAAIEFVSKRIFEIVQKKDDVVPGDEGSAGVDVRLNEAIIIPHGHASSANTIVNNKVAIQVKPRT